MYLSSIVVRPQCDVFIWVMNMSSLGIWELARSGFCLCHDLAFLLIVPFIRLRSKGTKRFRQLFEVYLLCVLRGLLALTLTGLFVVLSWLGPCYFIWCMVHKPFGLVETYVGLSAEQTCSVCRYQFGWINQFLVSGLTSCDFLCVGYLLGTQVCDPAGCHCEFSLVCWGYLIASSCCNFFRSLSQGFSSMVLYV